MNQGHKGGSIQTIKKTIPNPRSLSRRIHGKRFYKIMK